MLRGNRYVNAGISAGKTTVAHTGKVAHTLWLEVTGFIFSAFAVIGAVAARKEYAALQNPWNRDPRFLITLAFTVMFAWFGISAFYKARRR
jgi:tryptophan-rich sensory protein